MAKKAESPVYSQPTLNEKESRWQCATCKGYLAFSLPIDVKAMSVLLKTFSKAHERCAPTPDKPAAKATTSPRPPGSRRGPLVGSQGSLPLPAPGMSYDPEGPTAKAHARREVLLALTRDHTPEERRELTQLETKLVAAGVLTISTTF